MTRRIILVGLLGMLGCSGDPFAKGPTPHDFGTKLVDLPIPNNGAFTGVLQTDLDVVWNHDTVYIGLLRYPVYAWRNGDAVSGSDIIDFGGTTVYRVDPRTMKWADTAAPKDLLIADHSHGYFAGEGCVFRTLTTIELYAGGVWHHVPLPPDAATSEQVLGREDGRLAVADGTGLYLYDGVWHTLAVAAGASPRHVSGDEDLSLGAWDDAGLRLTRFVRSRSTITTELYDTTTRAMVGVPVRIATAAVGGGGTLTGSRNGTTSDFTVGLFAGSQDTELYRFSAGAFTPTGTMHGHRLVNSPGSARLLGGNVAGLGINPLVDITVTSQAGGFVRVVDGVPGDSVLDEFNAPVVCDLIDVGGPYELPLEFKGAYCSGSVGIAPSRDAESIAVASVQSRIQLSSARLTLRVLPLPHAGGLFAP